MPSRTDRQNGTQQIIPTLCTGNESMTIYNPSVGTD